MFNNKKSQIMRHPYITLALVGLATVGVVSISEKVKRFCKCKGHSMPNILCRMKSDSDMMHNMNQ